MNVTFEKLQEAREKFGEVQAKYRELGAQDTEPRCVLHWCARQTVKKGAVILPGDPVDDGNAWELYSCTPGYKRANNALTASAKKLLALLLQAPVAAVREFERYYDMGIELG